MAPRHFVSTALLSGLPLFASLSLLSQESLQLKEKKSAVNCVVLVNHICESIKDRLSLAKALTTVVYLIMLNHI